MAGDVLLYKVRYECGSLLHGYETGFEYGELVDDILYLPPAIDCLKVVEVGDPLC